MIGVERRFVVLAAVFLGVASMSRAALGEPNADDEAARLMVKGKWAEAAVVWRAILVDRPGDEQAEQSLVRTLVYSGRREEALAQLGQSSGGKKGRIRSIARLFLTETTFQTFQEGLNWMLAGKYKAARERFEKALEIEPDNVEILGRLGQCLVMEKDYDSAAERLRLARRLDPYEPQIKLWLGRALYERGELAAATAELAAAKMELKNEPLATYWYSDILTATGKTKQATEVLNQLNKRPQAGIDTHIRIGADLGFSAGL